MSSLKLGVSPLTNTIYVGKTRIKNGLELWVGEKQDVTISCLTATVAHCLKAGGVVTLETTEGVVEFEISVKDLRAENTSGKVEK